MGRIYISRCTALSHRQLAGRNLRRNLEKTDPGIMAAPAAGNFNPMGRYPISMTEHLISLAISTALGFLAGLGVGGGSLLLLWLTQVVHLPQPQARIINLLFYFPSAIIATIMNKRQKKIRPEIVRPGSIAGICAAAIIAICSRNWDLQFLQKLLGCLFILTGLREIFYRPRYAR